MNKMKNVRFSTLIAGLLIIAAGVLLSLFNYGVLLPEYKKIVFSMPSLLVAIGFICVFARNSRGFGVILMLVGGFFLMKKMQLSGFDFLYRNIWAIVLVIAGIMVLCKAFCGRHFCCCSRKDFDDSHSRNCSDNHCRHGKHWRKQWKKHWSRNMYHEEHKNSQGYIERNYIFGGAREKLDTNDFRGGDINCVFGGLELDLSDAKLAEGVHYLEINNVFGGMVLYVPVDWKIEIQQTRFFGNFVDSRPKPTFTVDEKRVLLLEVNAVFGGGEIKVKQ